MKNGVLTFGYLLNIDQQLDKLFEFLVTNECPDKRLMSVVASASLDIHREYVKYKNVCESCPDSKSELR